MIDRVGDAILAIPMLVAASARVVQEETVGFWEHASRAQKIGTAMLTVVGLMGVLLSVGVGLSTMIGLGPRVQTLEAQHDTIMGNRSSTQFRAEHVQSIRSAVTVETLQEVRDEIVCEVNLVLPSDCNFWINNGRPDRLRRGG